MVNVMLRTETVLATQTGDLLSADSLQISHQGCLLNFVLCLFSSHSNSDTILRGVSVVRGDLSLIHCFVQTAALKFCLE